MSVVITGATGGVGEAVARNFASNGYNITLLGRNEDKLIKLSESISGNNHVLVKYYLCDVEKESTLTTSINAINESPDEVNILINVAGVFPFGPLREMEVGVYDNCMSVNLKLPLILSTGLFEKLKQGKGGKIINIGSSSSYSGFKHTVIYCASKHALLGFSRALNDEWKNFGITVHCISPGTIDTKMANVLKQDSSTYINTMEFAELVYDVSCYEGNMLVEEVRAVRRVIR
jgi:short-subunit dehydrogenase